MLETQMANMDNRELIPNPEDNQGIQALLKIMAHALTNWFQTSFKAIPKDTVSTHNIKW